MVKLILVIIGVCALMGCGGGGGGGGGDTGPSPISSANAPPQNTNPVALADETASTTIKVLGLFTPGAEQMYENVDLRVQHLFNVLNSIFENSKVAATVELTHLELVDYPDGSDAETALFELTQGGHASLKGVKALRDQTKSDLVVLFQRYSNDGLCGFAWIGADGRNGNVAPSDADHAYSVVSINCADDTLAHEIGHNLGLVHSRRTNPEGGTLPYSAGYGVDGRFVTLMAQPNEYDAKRLPVLSSPDLTCNDVPCGISSEDQVNGADSVKTLLLIKDKIAAYR